jgi:hypothetical protein
VKMRRGRNSFLVVWNPWGQGTEVKVYGRHIWTVAAKGEGSGVEQRLVWKFIWTTRNWRIMIFYIGKLFGWERNICDLGRSIIKGMLWNYSFIWKVYI